MVHTHTQVHTNFQPFRFCKILFANSEVRFEIANVYVNTSGECWACEHWCIHAATAFTPHLLLILIMVMILHDAFTNCIQIRECGIIHCDNWRVNGYFRLFPASEHCAWSPACFAAEWMESKRMSWPNYSIDIRINKFNSCGKMIHYFMILRRIDERSDMQWMINLLPLRVQFAFACGLRMHAKC